MNVLLCDEANNNKILSIQYMSPKFVDNKYRGHIDFQCVDFHTKPLLKIECAIYVVFTENLDNLLISLLHLYKIYIVSRSQSQHPQRIKPLNQGNLFIFCSILIKSNSVQ